MIIVEGADNSGKSSLTRQLSKALEVPHILSGKTPPGNVDAFKHCMNQMNTNMAVRDRLSTISELVYGPIIRGKTALGMFHTEALSHLMCSDVLVVYCRPPLKKILNNRGRHQMLGVLPNHEKIVERYDSLMEDLRRFGSCTVVYYDWTSGVELNELIRKCKVYMERRRERDLSIKFQTGKF